MTECESQQATSVRRSRPTYLALVVFVIVLGLASRRYSALLPGWLAENAGDALWALCVYLVAGVLRPSVKVAWLGVGALLFAFAIEFSQCYHAPWIDSLRAIRLAQLLLGSGFLWEDLLRYTAGVALGMLGEGVIFRTLARK